MAIIPHMDVFAILLVAFVAIIVAGANAIRQGHGNSVTGYFLAGGKAGWLAEAGSVFVTTSWSLICVFCILPAAWKTDGWSAAGAIAAAAMILLGLAYVPLYRGAGCVTVPQYFAGRFGRRVGVAMSVSSTLLTLCVRIPLAIAVGGTLLHHIMGWDRTLTAILAIVVPGLLAVAGGFSAVLAMQGVEAVIAMGSLALVAAGGGAGYEGVMEGVRYDGPISTPLVAAAAVLMGGWYMCGDQFSVQRMLAVHSSAAARKGLVVAAALVAAGVLVLAAGGNGVFQASPATFRADVASTVIGTGVLAMTMAYVSGQFLSVATMFTMDVLPTIRRERGEDSLVLVGRLTTSVTAILAMLTALSVSALPAIPEGWFVLPYIVVVPPLAAVTLIGSHWRRLNGRGVRWGLGTGWMTGALFAGLRIADRVSIAACIEGALVAFLAAALALVGVSFLATPRAAPAGLPRVAK